LEFINDSAIEFHALDFNMLNIALVNQPDFFEPGKSSPQPARHLPSFSAADD
jgi:hypothetical protein